MRNGGRVYSASQLCILDFLLLHVVLTKKSIKRMLYNSPVQEAQIMSLQTRSDDRQIVPPAAPALDFQSIHAEKEVGDTRYVCLCIFVKMLCCHLLAQKHVQVFQSAVTLFKLFLFIKYSMVKNNPRTFQNDFEQSMSATLKLNCLRQTKWFACNSRNSPEVSIRSITVEENPTFHLRVPGFGSENIEDWSF